MKNRNPNSVWKLTRPAGTQSLSLCVACFALFIFGCPKEPVKPSLGKTGLIKPPIVTARLVDPVTPDFGPPGLGRWPGQAFVLNIPAPRAPAPRRLPTATEPEVEPTKPASPQISPQLSPEERARAQGAAENDLRIAQQNLDAAAARRLNEMQQDLADKVRSFLKQTQEAIAAADWVRARNLAQKARLLSIELANSF
jgi:hypothetical protein